MLRPDILRRAPLLHLGDRHQPRVVILVALERQANTLDGVGNEADRAIVIDRFKSFNHAGHVMAAEIGHQRQEFVVGALVDQLRHRTLIADIVLKMFAERRAALKAQGRVHRVRAGIDPAF